MFCEVDLHVAQDVVILLRKSLYHAAKSHGGDLGSKAHAHQLDVSLLVYEPDQRVELLQIFEVLLVIGMTR